MKALPTTKIITSRTWSKATNLYVRSIYSVVQPVLVQQHVFLSVYGCTNHHHRHHHNHYSFSSFRYQSSSVTTSSEDESVNESSLYTSSSSFSSSSTSSSSPSPLYVAATRQHVGKTTTSMALLSGLQKRFDRIGFMKPIGQESLEVKVDVDVDVDVKASVANTSNNTSTTTTADNTTTTIMVDKDTVVVKEHFGLDYLSYADMSPVVIPKGYTRDYLDGKISRYYQQEELIKNAYQNIVHQSSNSKKVSSSVSSKLSSSSPSLNGDIDTDTDGTESSDGDNDNSNSIGDIIGNDSVVLCEGTGHCAVGSIVHASNAQVASWLGAKMILIANGGIGKTFDELELNKTLCDKEGVEICGVIINKVHPEKIHQTREYITKAIKLHWGNNNDSNFGATTTNYDNIILGIIPDNPLLNKPSLTNYEKLFGTKLVTGTQYRNKRHYRPTADLCLVVTSLDLFLQELQLQSQLQSKSQQQGKMYVCHSSRDDIILGFLSSFNDANATADNNNNNEHYYYHESALIITGIDEHPLNDKVMDAINNTTTRIRRPPIMVVPHSTERIIKLLSNYSPKLTKEDTIRADTAADHYEKYIDFDLLLDRAGYNNNNSNKQEQEQH